MSDHPSSPARRTIKIGGEMDSGRDPNRAGPPGGGRLAVESGKSLGEFAHVMIWCPRTARPATPAGRRQRGRSRVARSHLRVSQTTEDRQSIADRGLQEGRRQGQRLCAGEFVGRGGDPGQGIPWRKGCWVGLPRYGHGHCPRYQTGARIDRGRAGGRRPFGGHATRGLRRPSRDWPQESPGADKEAGENRAVQGETPGARRSGGPSRGGDREDHREERGKKEDR